MFAKREIWKYQIKCKCVTNDVQAKRREKTDHTESVLFSRRNEEQTFAAYSAAVSKAYRTYGVHELLPIVGSISLATDEFRTAFAGRYCLVTRPDTMKSSIWSVPNRFIISKVTKLFNHCYLINFPLSIIMLLMVLFKSLYASMSGFGRMF